MIQITMILTSFLITIFYGIYVTNANAISGYSSLWQQVTIASGIAHDNDLKEMIEDGKGAEIVCQYCNTTYNFTTEELTEILEKKHRVENR